MLPAMLFNDKAMVRIQSYFFNYKNLLWIKGFVYLFALRYV